MSYAAQADIEAAFGVDNVRMWSNLDGDTNATDTARVASAIAYADDVINSRFRGGKYSIPLTATEMVKNWCARLAGMWLFESRPASVEPDKNFEDVRGAVNGEMSACLAGITNLDSALSVSRGGPAVV
jgi:phage gp36-like protein